MTGRVTCPRCGNPDARAGAHHAGHCPVCFTSWRTDTPPVYAAPFTGTVTRRKPCDGIGQPPDGPTNYGVGTCPVCRANVPTDDDVIDPHTVGVIG